MVEEEDAAVQLHTLEFDPAKGCVSRKTTAVSAPLLTPSVLEEEIRKRFKREDYLGLTFPLEFGELSHHDLKDDQLRDLLRISTHGGLPEEREDESGNRVRILWYLCPGNDSRFKNQKSGVLGVREEDVAPAKVPIRRCINRVVSEIAPFHTETNKGKRMARISLVTSRGFRCDFFDKDRNSTRRFLRVLIVGDVWWKDRFNMTDGEAVVAPWLHAAVVREFKERKRRWFAGQNKGPGTTEEGEDNVDGDGNGNEKSEPCTTQFRLFGPDYLFPLSKGVWICWLAEWLPTVHWPSGEVAKPDVILLGETIKVPSLKILPHFDACKNSVIPPRQPIRFTLNGTPPANGIDAPSLPPPVFNVLYQYEGPLSVVALSHEKRPRGRGSLAPQVMNSAWGFPKETFVEIAKKAAEKASSLEDVRFSLGMKALRKNMGNNSPWEDGEDEDEDDELDDLREIEDARGCTDRGRLMMQAAAGGASSSAGPSASPATTNSVLQAVPSNDDIVGLAFLGGFFENNSYDPWLLEKNSEAREKKMRFDTKRLPVPEGGRCMSLRLLADLTGKLMPGQAFAAVECDGDPQGRGDGLWVPEGNKTVFRYPICGPLEIAYNVEFVGRGSPVFHLMIALGLKNVCILSVQGPPEGSSIPVHVRMGNADFDGDKVCVLDHPLFETPDLEFVQQLAEREEQEDRRETQPAPAPAAAAAAAASAGSVTTIRPQAPLSPIGEDGDMSDTDGPLEEIHPPPTRKPIFLPPESSSSASRMPLKRTEEARETEQERPCKRPSFEGGSAPEEGERRGLRQTEARGAGSPAYPRPPPSTFTPDRIRPPAPSLQGTPEGLLRTLPCSSSAVLTGGGMQVIPSFLNQNADGALLRGPFSPSSAVIPGGGQRASSVRPAVPPERQSSGTGRLSHPPLEGGEGVGRVSVGSVSCMEGVVKRFVTDTAEIVWMQREKKVLSIGEVSNELEKIISFGPERILRNKVLYDCLKGLLRLVPRATDWMKHEEKGPPCRTELEKFSRMIDQKLAEKIVSDDEDADDSNVTPTMMLTVPFWKWAHQEKEWGETSNDGLSGATKRRPVVNDCVLEMIRQVFLERLQKCKEEKDELMKSAQIDELIDNYVAKLLIEWNQTCIKGEIGDLWDKWKKRFGTAGTLVRKDNQQRQRESRGCVFDHHGLQRRLSSSSPAELDFDNVVIDIDREIHQKAERLGIRPRDLMALLYYFWDGLKKEGRNSFPWKVGLHHLLELRSEIQRQLPGQYGLVLSFGSVGAMTFRGRN
uniref:RNA-dependent RNA polymerase n=1 Tax=Chromera velia CCMP2878 TaxID=1169474 RepID=A0A0G4GDH0_9ALVE|eukprot:Cvel_4547.t1-p1 / transcript=Cvel_4547.t1 / gene=Cvel_4547 / organism=Chromera_velia_CCMP2878 / gene_product=hypothetical protein / transcript_product=hypothetical protein / location=Cvel_scaffold199:67715-75435(+) / protein_length=1266 / sequence_SO=supercontig / SO=protein_coding / is_pseudo=false